MDTIETKNTKKHICVKCGKRFISKRFLENHINNKTLCVTQHITNEHSDCVVNPHLS